MSFVGFYGKSIAMYARRDSARGSGGSYVRRPAEVSAVENAEGVA